MKKKLPLSFLKGIKRGTNKSFDLIKAIYGDDFLIKFIDKDPSSDFFFEITKHDARTNKYIIRHLPSHAQNVTIHSTALSIGDVNNRLESWANTIAEYEELDTIIDDPILKSFQDEYYSSFDIVDEDAEYAPFNTDKILILDQHLSFIKDKINSYPDQEQREILKPVIVEIEKVRQHLTDKSKKWVIKNLSYIWAKLSKHSVNVLKEVVKEGQKQLITRGWKFILDRGQELID